MTPDARQKATWAWANETVGSDVDLETRLSRFLEEAVELVQAGGMTRAKAYRVIHYVFERAKGEPAQEIGGVMITLTLAAEALGISVDEAWAAEFDRIHQPDVIAKVRGRQIEKRAAGL